MLTFMLGSLWMVSTIGRPKTGWDPTYILRYGWLEYTDGDGSPEDVCDCSAILLGDRETLEQAKLLTMRKDFQKSVQIPDEHYINATQDCRYVALKYRFRGLLYILKGRHQCCDLCHLFLLMAEWEFLFNHPWERTIKMKIKMLFNRNLKSAHIPWYICSM